MPVKKFLLLSIGLLFFIYFISLVSSISWHTKSGGLVVTAKQPVLERDNVSAYQKDIQRLSPLHTKFDPGGPLDWIANHQEHGQTFLEYIHSNPAVPTQKRDIIYILPLGTFDQAQERVVRLTAEFLGYFFNRPVVIKAAIPLTEIPAAARRMHPSWGVPQVLTSYVLETIMIPKLPEDAAAYIALTTSDLWPGEGWNFVFGQASLDDRVGVWSLYRNGDPAKSDPDFRTCLVRTIKTAAHELAHIFSVKHCIAYECLMNGSNSREESDRGPLALCPECWAKIIWATGADPVQRYVRLEDFCRRQGLTAEADFYKKSLSILKTHTDLVAN